MLLSLRFLALSRRVGVHSFENRNLDSGAYGVRRQSAASTALFLEAEPTRKVRNRSAARSARKTKRCRRCALPPQSKYSANQHVTMYVL